MSILIQKIPKNYTLVFFLWGRTDNRAEVLIICKEGTSVVVCLLCSH